MKKIEYLAPESKVYVLGMKNSILSASGGEGSSPSGGGTIDGEGPGE